ncbi:MAG: hypothetical protein L3J92_05350 [Thermoplasmata archaeon]|jgi:hypothetical protein|nr:hypothetical protein [Thermoplasmata archaeon]
MAEEFPLPSNQDQIFDLSDLAAEGDRRSKPTFTLFLVLPIAVGGMLLAIGILQASVLGGSLSPIYLGAVGVIVAIGVIAYFATRHLRNPVKIVVGREGVQFDYPAGISRSSKWSDPKLRIYLVDQTEAKSPRLYPVSDFMGRFDGARPVQGTFSPIAKGAYEETLAWARKLDLPISSHPINLGRGAVRKDPTIHRIRHANDIRAE